MTNRRNKQRKQNPPTLSTRTPEQVQREYSEICVQIGDMLCKTFLSLHPKLQRVNELNAEITNLKQSETNENS